MKTTLELPDDFMIEAKTIAEKFKITFRSLTEAALRRDTGSLSTARTLLQEFTCQHGHQFGDDTISLVDLRKFPTRHGSKNLTDHYLLALAIKNRGKLFTFDQRIEPSLLQGGISSYYVKKRFWSVKIAFAILTKNHPFS